ncbi:MAG: penicillin-binding transpeptidase domain-containing protein [Bacteroidales bacterium]|jgi:cell division protein FtsI (penicillin-binding protein 3)|nr:penicillin-binding transpeptidase domain-containing protein [Bacteroidales bacterium]MDD4214746.1 penicillin-binding transpeptidase domain-containing protein [Bacteroidales bacterium]
MREKRKSILARAYLIYILVVIFAVIIVGRIIHIQFVEGDYWKRQASQKNEISVAFDPRPGFIYADNKDLLAVSLPVYQVNINLDTSALKDSTFNKYVGYMGTYLSLFNDKTTKNRSKYIKQLRKAQNNKYYLLFKEVNLTELKKIKRFYNLLGKEKHDALTITKTFKRIYPLKNLAYFTIGYERLAEYDVSIRIKDLKNQEKKCIKNLDTLSQSFSNIFGEYSRDYYRDDLINTYRGKRGGVMKKKIDVFQLQELTKLPVIKDGIPSKKDIISYIDSIYKKTENPVRLGILDIKKCSESHFIGLQGHYHNELRGQKGFVVQRKVGTTFVDVPDNTNLRPSNGDDLYTTIDINLQDVAQSALRKSLDSTHADWGCAVLMEVKTGHIKAMSNLSIGKDGKYYEKRNYAYRQRFEPGSTLKLASVIAALERGRHDTSFIVLSGQIKYSDYPKTIVDSHKEGYGYISVGKAFEKSSNVGITYLTREAFKKDPNNKNDIELDKFKNLIIRMGLTQKTGVDLYRETSPFFPFMEPPFVRADFIAVAFGYAAELTPLQILAFYNAVANDGKYMKPMLVKAIGKHKPSGDTIIQRHPEVLIEQICSKSTIIKVKKLLEGVVIRGTAHNIGSSVYKIAGKTGTAEIKDRGGNFVGHVASFCGYFPADDPMYSCIVVEFNMKGINVFGSDVAAPVFKEIADKVYSTRVDIKIKENKMPEKLSLPQLSIGYRSDIEKICTHLNFPFIKGKNTSEWSSLNKNKNQVYQSDVRIVDKWMPDTKGMTAKDAVYLLEKTGVKVIVRGKGRVQEQLYNKEKKTIILKLESNV